MLAASNPTPATSHNWIGRKESTFGIARILLLYSLEGEIGGESMDFGGERQELHRKLSWVMIWGALSALRLACK
jgi:hypothetical protein